MKESTIKIITVLMLVAILVVIYILNPSFYSDFWRVATSGSMQETMDYIASFGIWAMVFSFLLDVLINALGFLPSIFVSTANGLLNSCTRVSASQAKPGDLIFFQGTYDTSGASHVGIYVGNGMMIHCGNPIKYSSVNTTYWQNHFLCYGRIN